MTYREIDNSEVAENAPVTALLMAALRDNLKAVLEDDATAPDIAASALDQPPVGTGDTYQDVSASRAIGTSYQNTTGKPIEVLVRIADGGGGADRTGFQISTDNSTWLTLLDSDNGNSLTVTVANGEYVRVVQLNGTGAAIVSWHERRP